MLLLLCVTLHSAARFFWKTGEIQKKIARTEPGYVRKDPVFPEDSVVKSNTININISWHNFSTIEAVLSLIIYPQYIFSMHK